jgi:integrase
MKLQEFCDSYVASLTISQSTRKSYGQAIQWACRYFGKDRPLDSIAATDFGEYLDFLLLKLASSSAKRHAKRLRSILREATEQGLIPTNPASGFNLFSPPDRSLPLVSIADSLRIMDHCPTADWRLLVALTRFAGLRPVEVLDLEWKHVRADRLKVYSRRGGIRDCPLFAPLRQVLEHARDIPGRSPTYVLSHVRDHTNVTTALRKIIRSAGVPPISKPFYAFALTRRRELLQTIRFAAVNDWLQLDFRKPAYSTVDDWSQALAIECDYRMPVLPWR